MENELGQLGNALEEKQNLFSTGNAMKVHNMNNNFNSKITEMPNSCQLKHLCILCDQQKWEEKE